MNLCLYFVGLQLTQMLRITALGFR
uniref:Uncharacterized protein n=1 Tax=Arundo donax TaxID=35708 RepID=A0A0A9QEQ7_ARUDO